jgi:hypothetical protein
MTLAKTIFASAILAVGIVAAASPAAAVVTTFASFNAVSVGNLYYVNNGTGGSTSTYRSNGTGGTISTTNSHSSVRPSLAVPGAVDTSFSFLNSLSPFVSNVPAKFTLLASVTNSPALTVSGFKLQQNLAGSFSFISENAITIGSVTHAAGSNLLSGTFNLGTIFGAAGGTSGSMSSSVNSGSMITYTSDFLDFTNTTSRDLSLSLTSIVSLVSNVNQGLNNASGKALRSFRATSTGSFSSDPAPLVIGVPEPQSWAMLVIGFGLIGVSARRRARATRSVAA